MRVSSSKEIPEYEIIPSKLKFKGSKSKLPDVSSCNLLILPQLRMAWEYKPIKSIYGVIFDVYWLADFGRVTLGLRVKTRNLRAACVSRVLRKLSSLADDRSNVQEYNVLKMRFVPGFSVGVFNLS